MLRHLLVLLLCILSFFSYSPQALAECTVQSGRGQIINTSLAYSERFGVWLDTEAKVGNNC